MVVQRHLEEAARKRCVIDDRCVARSPIQLYRTKYVSSMQINDRQRALTWDDAACAQAVAINGAIDSKGYRRVILEGKKSIARQYAAKRRCT